MVEIITNKLNPQVLPHLDVWNWEVPVYLFLGGLSAGLLVLASGLLLLQKGGVFSHTERGPFSYAVKGVHCSLQFCSALACFSYFWI